MTCRQTLDGLTRALVDICGRRRGQSLPAGFEVLEPGCVLRVVSPVTVPFQRGASRSDLVADLFRLAILGVQRIAFLLEDLVDTLVFVADLRQQLPELRRIADRFGRQLPQSARRTFHDEHCDLRRILDRGQCLRQATGVFTQCRHGEHFRLVSRAVTICAEIDGALIDESGHARTRGTFHLRRMRDCGACDRTA